MVTAQDVRDLRALLRLTQVELSALIGVHWLTVSRWERELRPVPPFHAALLQALLEGARQSEPWAVAEMLTLRGAPFTLYYVLNLRFGGDGDAAAP